MYVFGKRKKTHWDPHITTAGLFTANTQIQLICVGCIWGCGKSAVSVWVIEYTMKVKWLDSLEILTQDKGYHLGYTLCLEWKF